MLIYCIHITPRLQYIVDFIASQISNEDWKITDDEFQFIHSDDHKINYSNIIFDGNILQIQPNSLLFEDDIKPQQINCTKVNKVTIFFHNKSVIGFDVFAASFYLLSRYEEYLPHTKDKHDRYDHQNSLAFKNSFLQQPLINIWLKQFSKLLQKQFRTFNTKKQSFTFLPTYDIDIAWSYRHKSVWRNLGGFARDFFELKIKNCKERIATLIGFQKDPYNNFDWLQKLHQQNNIQAKYFFLVAEKTSAKDKNISPHHPAMKQLIKNVLEINSIGLHPSWQSGNNFSILKKEKNILESISKKQIISSRQHYLRLSFPNTYRHLIEAGIKEDHSMGYAGSNGFRASVASSFYWFDLLNNKKTDLKIFPFCHMDATSIHYKNQNHKEALSEINHLYNAVKSVDGFFCTLWHNDTFNNADWSNIYKDFIDEISK